MFVTISSHKASNSVTRLLGYKPQGYYDANKMWGDHYYAIAVGRTQGITYPRITTNRR